MLTGSQVTEATDRKVPPSLITIREQIYLTDLVTQHSWGSPGFPTTCGTTYENLRAADGWVQQWGRTGTGGYYTIFIKVRLWGRLKSSGIIGPGQNRWIIWRTGMLERFLEQNTLPGKTRKYRWTPSWEHNQRVRKRRLLQEIERKSSCCPLKGHQVLRKMNRMRKGAANMLH